MVQTEQAGMWSIHFFIIGHQGKGKEVNKLCAWDICMETFFQASYKKQLFITSGNTLASSDDPRLVSMVTQQDYCSGSFMVTT